jgi:hypothetical protein
LFVIRLTALKNFDTRAPSDIFIGQIRYANSSHCGSGEPVDHHVTGSHVSGSDVRHVTGNDVIFRRFFLTRVVVQHVPLHEDTKGIIRSRQSNDKQYNDLKIPKE